MLVHLRLALSQGLRHRTTPHWDWFWWMHLGTHCSQWRLCHQARTVLWVHMWTNDLPHKQGDPWILSKSCWWGGRTWQLFAIGCGVADAEYTWHDLMPSPPFNASYIISWFRRTVSVAGDLQETSSASYQRAKNVIWTAATCRKAGVKPNTLVEVPLLGETNTCTCSRVCACIHTLLEWMILEAWALPH